MRWPLPWPKSWRHESPPKDEEPEEDREEDPKSLRQSTLLFARDLAVAFLIVAIVMGLLFAYTQVWPPMVVVESDSMQHSGTSSFVGVIDTGDLVLVQAVHARSDITTYVEARATGSETYSNFGDVIIFHAPGRAIDATPIIHRAMVYVVRNASGGVDVPSLADLDASQWSGMWGAQPATAPLHLTQLTLKAVRSWHMNGPSTVDISWETGSVRTSGFLTKGDHNPGPNGDGWGDAVGVERIVGKARGELPWFGLIKLTLAPGASGCCPGWGRGAPRNSWDSLLISLVVIIVGPFAADFGWAFWKDWRKEKRAQARAAKAGPSAEPTSSADEAPGDPSPPDPEPQVTDEARTTSAGPEAGDPEDL